MFSHPEIYKPEEGFDLYYHTDIYNDVQVMAFEFKLEENIYLVFREQFESVHSGELEIFFMTARFAIKNRGDIKFNDPVARVHEDDFLSGELEQLIQDQLDNFCKFAKIVLQDTAVKDIIFGKIVEYYEDNGW